MYYEDWTQDWQLCDRLVFQWPLVVLQLKHHEARKAFFPPLTPLGRGAAAQAKSVTLRKSNPEVFQPEQRLYEMIWPPFIGRREGVGGGAAALSRSGRLRTRATTLT